ncbi:MAG: hypothetical protein KAS59_09030 [Alphaproteobacteria bacterium]|nr:hypothetical protein [Alphaproteobacteria bacterium]
MPQENQVDAVFEEEYTNLVKVAYQRQGSLLRKTVQNLNNVEGKKAYFPKFGKGADPEQKTRGGDIPIDDVAQSLVGVDLVDYYSGILRDKLDLLKTNTDQKMLAANDMAYKFGRKTDALIVAALGNTSLTVGDYSTAFTNTLLMQALEKLYNNDVPEDGQIFGVLSSHAWNEFKTFSKVSTLDYAGELYPWLKGRQAFIWNNVVWMQFTGLPLADTDNRDCFLYHKFAAGHASCSDLNVDIDWVPLKKAFLIGGDMSQGAGIIDGGTDGGVVKIKVKDDVAIT